MLAEHFHHPAVRRHMVVDRNNLADRTAGLSLEDISQTVRVRLIGAKEPEVSGLRAPREQVAHQLAELAGRFAPLGRGVRDSDRVATDIGQIEIQDFFTAVGVGIRPHPPIAFGRECGQVRKKPALVVKEFFRPIAAQPLFQHLEMHRIGSHMGQRHLMSAKRSFYRQAIDDLRPRPPFQTAEHDGRPSRPLRKSRCTCAGLDGTDFCIAGVDRRRERLMHRHRIVPLDKMNVITVRVEELVDILISIPAQHRRSGNFVAIQMEDRKHCAIVDGVQKLDAFPRTLERSRLRFSIADHRDSNEIGIVENRAKGVREDVAQFAPLVNRAGSLDARVARNAPWRRKLAEQMPQSRHVLRDARVNLRVGPFQIHVGDDRGTAVSGAGQVDNVRIGVLNQPVEMRIDKAEAWRRPPVAQQPRLDVFRAQRFSEQRIVLQINLADCQVIGCAPISVELPQPLRRGRRRVSLLGRDRIFDDVHWLFPLTPDEMMCVSGDHQFLIRLHHAHRDWTVVPRNNRRVVFVAKRIQTNA